MPPNHLHHHSNFSDKSLLAIDYGEKWIGLAIKPCKSFLATPIVAIENISVNYYLKKIAEICQINKIDFIVLGLPLTLDGLQSEMTKKVKQFAFRIKKNISLPIIFQDER